MNEVLEQRIRTLIVRQEVIQEEQIEINKEIRELLSDIRLDVVKDGDRR